MCHLEDNCAACKVEKGSATCLIEDRCAICKEENYFREPRDGAIRICNGCKLDILECSQDRETNCIECAYIITMNSDGEILKSKGCSIQGKLIKHAAAIEASTQFLLEYINTWNETRLGVKK